MWGLATWRWCRIAALSILAAALGGAPSFAVTLSSTDFEGFTTGASVDGQGGWSVDNSNFDESVVDFGGNTVWRVSNSFTSGSFGDQPFAPRPGGIPNPPSDPVNSNPNSFAGETSTGASFKSFTAEFDFRSATGAAQPGLSVTVSPDNGLGGRQGFVDIEDNGGGLDLVTFDVDSTGNFIGPQTIASGLAYDEFHKLGIEVLFNDGPDNDVVNYYLDGTQIHSNGSWEQFYRMFQPGTHPNGPPIQTLLYRLSGTPEGSVDGNGLFIDNVNIAVGEQFAPVPEPASLLIWGLGGLSCIALQTVRRRKRG